MVVTLLGLRVLLELALIAAVGVVGYQLSDQVLVSAMLAVAFAGATIVVWGLLLSPRRRVDLSLAVRVIIELGLFAVAAGGLVWIGQAAWGWALLIAEVVVLAGLWAKGLPPGSSGG